MDAILKTGAALEKCVLVDDERQEILAMDLIELFETAFDRGKDGIRGCGWHTVVELLDAVINGLQGKKGA
jgi:hypothetical protein